LFEEQRQYRRFPFRAPARVRVGNEPAVEITTVDLSAGGISLRFTRVLARETQVTIEVAPPTGVKLQLNGLVRHCTAVVTETEGPSHRGIYIVGVEFGELASGERDALQQACAALAERAPR
jgi:c-di-GMP-binding flagellar brake protein YcgR